MRRFSLALSLTAVLATSAPALAQMATWKIDSAHSAATFAVRHLMVSTVRGTFGKLEGQVQFDGKDYKSLVADATIDATTITTREPQRDTHLKSPDFFDVAKYPTITFKSKRAEPVGPGKFRLVGDLTMRGVTKEVVLDVEATPEAKGMAGETRIGATATTRVNRQDYGVSWNKSLDAGGVVVGDDVQITLDVEIVKQAPAGSK